MNISTAFQSIAAITAVAFPATIATAAFDLPANSILGATFGVFVIALVVLTLAADYRTAKPLAINASCPVGLSARSALPLAA